MIRLILSIFIPVLAAVLLNAFIYLMGWNKEANKDSMPDVKGLPPGYAIAIIWIFILGLLGLAFYYVYPSVSAWIIVMAIVYCLAYPFLTFGLRQDNAWLLNLLSLVIAIIVAISVALQDVMVSLSVVPFVIWTLYVNIITNI